MQFSDTSRFRLLNKLGEGGMGVVYEAYDRARERRVALKKLRRLDPHSLFRFKREFRALSNFSHPNIITLYELISAGEDWFLTMEVIDGVDLVTYLRRDAASDAQSTGKISWEEPRFSSQEETLTSPVGPDDLVASPDALALLDEGLPVPPIRRSELGENVNVERLLDVSRQLARALYALHAAGMVHRDLKPSNVLVTREGRVVLMDFGIVAQMKTSASSTGSGALIGTPSYMAPEQIRGESPTPATDWYAFGVLLYNVLTGQLPYAGTEQRILLAKQTRDPLSPSRFARGIPQELEELCMRLLSRNAILRPSDKEVLAELGITSEVKRPSIDYTPTALGKGMFVGRERELAGLREAYESVSRGESLCVVVKGRSGIGKSHLLKQFLRGLRLRRPDAPLVFAGRCHERELLPHKAFDGIIDQLSTYLARLPEDKRDRLLGKRLEPLIQVFPVMRRAHACPTTVVEDDGALQTWRERAVVVLRELLADLAREQPIVIHIEDLHWADSDSLELLTELLRSPAPSRIMVVATLRSDAVESDDNPLLAEFLGSIDRCELCRHMHLGPLSDDEQRALVASLVKGRMPLDELSENLWREAAGHPMLLVELARYARDAGPEELRRCPTLQLEDVIWRRVTLLPEKDQQLLELIVVGGEPLPMRVLAEIGGFSLAAGERASAILRINHLARISRSDGEPWLEVYHNKVREAVMEHLPEERVRRLHWQLAQGLERWTRAPVVLLARQWLAAGDHERAAEHMVGAAREAVDKREFEQAAELYCAALEIEPGLWSDELLGDDPPDLVGDTTEPDAIAPVPMACHPTPPDTTSPGEITFH